MNFQIIGTGHSFKGAMSYYLHDKRQDGQAAHPVTSERVAFTETRNMMEVGPHTATRIMIGTAAQADQLKRDAGIKTTGRKATAGPVYAFSLQWEPNELEIFDRAEMVKHANAALKILGLSDRQAVIVAHQDTAHPHVHVIVNRVSPVDGRMATVGKDAVAKLNRYAYEYERDRGMIVSPNRAAVQEEIDRKRQQHPDQEKRRQYVQEQQAAKKAQQQFTRAAEATAGRPDSAKVKQTAATRGKSEGAILKELHDAQKARHKEEWAKLAAANKATREAVYSQFGATIRQQAEEHKTRTKPAWAAFFRAARMEERAFFARERSIVGILQNALAATPLGQRGSLSAVFSNVLSASNREAAFRAAQAHARAGMQDRVKAALDTEIAAVKQQRAAALSAQRRAYDTTRATLIERQNAEKAKMREAWRQAYERRGKDPRYQARQKAAPQQEQKRMRDTFDKARELAPAKNVPVPAVTPERLSSPAPAPSPAGEVPTVNKTPQPVPQIDRAADWAQSQQGRSSLSKDAPPPPAKAQFTKQAEPEQAKPSFADRFRQKAAERPAVDRQRDRERDFDRDR